MQVFRFSLIYLGMLILSLFPINSSSGQTSLDDMRQINPDMPPPLSIDEKVVAANGIRKLTGKHVTIYTDIPHRQHVKELPTVFDLAVPQWCQYFGIAKDRAENWHVRAMVMGDEKRFRSAGLIVEGMPTFLAGLQQGHEMWVYLQPGKYYTRHLMLHEGTHAFMQWFLGGMGAPWYTEGMAEMIGLHSWSNDQLQLNFRLTDRRQAEYWGRIKIIRQDRDQDQSMSIDEILEIPAASFRQVRFYAWSWAACEFFSKHPRTRQMFADLRRQAREDRNTFNRQFRKSIEPFRNELNIDWQLFVNEIDFGFEVDRAAICEIERKAERSFALDVTRGWQRTGIHVQANESVEIKTRGRFAVARENQTDWMCEANGITIEYYRQRPLGQLMIGVVTTDASELTGLIQPLPLPENGILKMKHTGTLCFRINESPAKLDDNHGQLEISIQKITP